MNAVNVGLVTFIIQHNRIQGVFLLCKITNLLIYSYKGKNKQLNQRKTKKEHQKQKIDTVFLTAFVYNELIKQERKP